MGKDLRELCELLETSLKEFIEFLKANPKIIGREPEMKCFFASNILLKKCGYSGVLREFTQIILESAVPQDPTKSERTGQGTKSQVCFDMTIWKEPNQTCFVIEDGKGKAKNFPLTIIEWKVKFGWAKKRGQGGGELEDYEADKEKLLNYTFAHQVELLAFAVWLNRSFGEKDTPFIKYSVFYKGKIFENKEDIKIP